MDHEPAPVEVFPVGSPTVTALVEEALTSRPDVRAMYYVDAVMHAELHAELRCPDRLVTRLNEALIRHFGSRPLYPPLARRVARGVLYGILTEMTREAEQRQADLRDRWREAESSPARLVLTTDEVAALPVRIVG